MAASVLLLCLTLTTCSVHHGCHEINLNVLHTPLEITIFRTSEETHRKVLLAGDVIQLQHKVT